MTETNNNTNINNHNIIYNKDITTEIVVNCPNCQDPRDHRKTKWQYI